MKKGVMVVWIGGGTLRIPLVPMSFSVYFRFHIVKFTKTLPSF